MNISKKFFLLLIIITSLLIISTLYSVSAGEESNSSEYYVTNSDNEIVLTVIMNAGTITIKGQSKAASTNIRWETIGLTITKEKIDTRTTFKHEASGIIFTGPGPVSDAYGSGKGVIWLSQGEKIPTSDGTTQIEISSALVEVALQENLTNLTKDTPIYLHCIFDTYEIVNGVKTIREGASGGIRNWKDIMGAEWWGTDTLNDFEKFFNMKILYKPAIQDNDLIYQTESGIVIKTKELDDVLPGGTVMWSNAETELTDNNKTYELVGYYVTAKGSTNKLASLDLNSSGSNLNSIRSNSYSPVELGGMNVHLVYREAMNVNVIIKALDRETKVQIYDGDLYSGSKKPNEEFVQPTNSIHYELSYRGTNYTRTYFYNYKYKSTSGVWITKSGTTKDSDAEKSVILTIPNDIEPGSTLTINTLYDPDPPGDIPITVNAILVETSGHETTKLLTNTTVSGDARFTYNIEASISLGGKTYLYNGAWKWKFMLNSTSNNVGVNTGSGTVVSFNAPSTDDIIGGITVNIYYDEGNPETGEITLRVIMVTSTGSLISQISTETVTFGQSISKTAPSTRSVNGVVYSYLSKWDYNYFTSSTNPSVTGTGTTASFQIPTSTKLGTIVTLRFYYSTSQTVEIPTSDAPISLSIDSPAPTGVINGDKYGDPYFNSSKGISTTESQYVFVKTKDYLLGYTLVNRTGKVTYIVPVTMSYTLKYYTATPVGVNGGPRLITEIVKDTQNIEVEKAYSYWEITNLEYYVADSAKVYNYSLPDGSVTLSANNSYMNLPSLSTWHGSTLNEHVMAPLQVTEGIEVNCTTIFSSTTSTRPNVEFEDLTAYAYTMTDEAYVRNDYISFNGSAVMSNAYTLKIAPDPNVSSFKHCNTVSQDKALFTQNNVIDAEKINGSYSSNGAVTYKLNSASINSSYSSKVFNITVNDVIIHTPVICEPVITADNNKWVQLLSPMKGAVQIVLDSDTTLNDFTVSVSNTLQHSNRLGYLIRDFSRSFIDPVNISYIAKQDGIVRNEMKLPFDVYIDIIKDNNPENDKFVKAGTWIILGRDTWRFYVPMWVKEGTYTAQFRTIAVNGTNRLNNTEVTRNSDIHNYVATATQIFQVSGRIFGLTLYDVSDYPNWENIFRVENTMLFKLFEGATDGTTRTTFNKSYAYSYKVGTKDQYGRDTTRLSKYTIPMVNISHPQYKNLGVIKTGYAVRFFLDTIGEMYSSGSHITITPTFYYVDADGKNRRRVDLYYNEEIKNMEYRIIKVGEGIDLVNIKTGTTGNVYSRIPIEELKNTAAVMNTTYSKIYNQCGTMYSYSMIKLIKEYRTFIGVDYASWICRWTTYNDVKAATGLTKTDLSKYTQRWYGTYKLPTDVHIAPAGYDVYGYLKNHGIDYMEDFWLKGGYIIVNFNIVTVDQSGKENLSYINADNYLNNGNCSMWVTEGAVVSKTDNRGTSFSFKAGDFAVFYSDKKFIDDYQGSLY